MLKREKVGHRVVGMVLILLMMMAVTGCGREQAAVRSDTMEL